jgi:hypothetical protein
LANFEFPLARRANHVEPLTLTGRRNARVQGVSFWARLATGRPALIMRCVWKLGARFLLRGAKERDRPGNETRPRPASYARRDDLTRGRLILFYAVAAAAV